MSRDRSAFPFRPTLADIGRAAGVSAMAASVVVNGSRTSARIAETTRRRILEAAVRLNYRPNAAAQGLACRRIRTLGVAGLFRGEELNDYLLEIIAGILAAAGSHEQNTTLFALRNWSDDSSRLHRFCDGRIDGMILVAPTLSRAEGRLLPAHTPFVALHANCPVDNVVNVESDEQTGAFEITRYVIGLGHRELLYVAGPRGLLGPERRIRGFRQALARAAIPFDSTRIVEAGCFSASAGRDALHRWLREHAGVELPQAIVCANDGIAIGCLEALAKVGIRVPDDVSLVGFDDTPSARTTLPQLATVRQPLAAMGRCAVEVLLKRVDQGVWASPGKKPDPIVFPVEIVPRPSLGVPRAVPCLIPPIRNSGSAVGQRKMARRPGEILAACV